MNALINSPHLLEVPDVADLAVETQADEGPPLRPRETVRLADLREPVAGDGKSLVGNRFLCRGGCCLLVGPTGAGKSSLALQWAILGSIGKPLFGLRHAAPLRVLYVQAENDEGDLWEIRRGIFDGLELSGPERQRAGENVRLATVGDSVGTAFVEDVLLPLLTEHRPDLAILDPLLAYLGGDVTRQDVTSAFVRTGLQPAIARTECGLVLVHHPPKPRKDTGQGRAGEDAYLGAGSADLANWARAVLVLKATPQHGLYKLSLAKRGQRAGWMEADGQTPSFERTIAHGHRGLIYWREAEEGEQFKATPTDTAIHDLLALVPQKGRILKAAWVVAAKDKGVGEKRAGQILDTLEDSGQVYLWRMPRPNCRPAIAIAREPRPGVEV